MATETDGKVRKRILVVDDEPSIREFFKFVLESEGWEVHEAGSAEDALAQFEKHDFDLITLDCLMQGTDGLECHRALSERYGYGEARQESDQPKLPPILVITGWYELEDVQRMIFGERVVGILRKPVSAEKLLEVVRDHVRWEGLRHMRRVKSITRQIHKSQAACHA
ncbi:MAG: response regulator [Planctomycetes bacterium]|nr:response regulator [Planctomycetota bacterium]